MFGFDGPFSVSSTLEILPTTAEVMSGSTQTFSASGGTAPYVFSIVTNNSGGTIDPDTGEYTAGATPGVTDTIRVTDDAAATDDAFADVLPILAISPTSPTVPPLGTELFSGVGGSGTGYTWALTVNNSGGSIGALTGLYTAGTTGDVVDTVEVTDSLGNTGTTNVTVGPEVSISPPNPTVYFTSSEQFTAVGGSDAGFVWSITVNNSGGTIDADTGLYTAGAVASVTDTVQVVDDLGNVATTDVDVSPILAMWDVTFSPDTQGYLRFTLTDGGVFNLMLVHEGDLAYIYGDEFEPTNTRGTFEIKRVSVYYDPDLVQWFEIENPMGAELEDIEQDSLQDLMFFRPKRSTIYDSPRHVIVCERNN